MNSNWSYSPETLNSGQNRRFFVSCDLEIWWRTLKNNRAPLLSCFKLCASFHSHQWIQTKVTVWKRSIRVKIGDFLSCVTLKFDRWPWKTIRYLFYIASSFMRHFNKCKPNKDIILCENDNIINHLSEVANIFNDCFTAIADGIGFNDPIPVGYENDAVLKIMIAKYEDHPSIIAIKRLCPWVIPLHSLMSLWMRHIIENGLKKVYWIPWYSQ